MQVWMQIYSFIATGTLTISHLCFQWYNHLAVNRLKSFLTLMALYYIMDFIMVLTLKKNVSNRYMDRIEVRHLIIT